MNFEHEKKRFKMKGDLSGKTGQLSMNNLQIYSAKAIYLS